MEAAVSAPEEQPTPAKAEHKFGTFAGVFTPTILTILGAIMYLRHGWVIGNAGLVGGIVIILLAHLITICTGLAVSSIATNTKVGAGGAFAIISQSLGIEMGGSIGIPLYLAQGISVAFYVLAFTEGWVGIFPDHPFTLVAITSFFAVFLIAFISAQFAARIQFLIMAIIFVSLVSIALGSFPAIEGAQGLPNTPQLFGDFSEGSFWKTFAIFFPAVTGIMAGISMSGSLKSPRESLPSGTMGAVAVGLVAYLILAVWLAFAATPEELLDTTRVVLADKALWDWAIFAGLLGATFSSALGSIIAAPRVMQALAARKILPASDYFARETAKGDPRQATLFTGAIGLLGLFVALASGGLDAIADILTMFFLITYAMLNVVVLVEQTLSMVSFRPTFAVPRIVPFVGMVFCIFTMLLVNPTFTFVALIVVVIIYFVLSRRTLVNTEDVRSGLFNSLARWAVVRSSRMPQAVERSWSPMVLAPIVDTRELAGSYRFLRSITAPQGFIQALGIYTPETEHDFDNIDVLTDSFEKDGVMARATLLEEEDFANGVRSATQILRKVFFRPNILFFNLRPDSDNAHLTSLIETTAAYRMGTVLLSRHLVIDMGREQIINVWVRPNTDTWQWLPKLGNKDLSLLLAYQLRKNWQGQINLCVAATSDEEANRGQEILEELVTLARLPKSTGTYVMDGEFMQAIKNAPDADLTIIGLPSPADLDFCQKVTESVDGSCIFVRDSGDESAFA